MNRKGTWALTTSLPKFQIHWLLMVACWAHDAEMAQDIDTYARMQCPEISQSRTSLLLNNLELWNGKSTWTLIQILFQSSKMVGCQHWHVQWMVRRWPGTWIYVHRCIWLGRHGLKLVRYITESFEAQEALLPRQELWQIGGNYQMANTQVTIIYRHKNVVTKIDPPFLATSQ